MVVWCSTSASVLAGAAAADVSKRKLFKFDKHVLQNNRRAYRAKFDYVACSRKHWGRQVIRQLSSPTEIVFFPFSSHIVPLVLLER